MFDKMMRVLIVLFVLLSTNVGLSQYCTDAFSMKSNNSEELQNPPSINDTIANKDGRVLVVTLDDVEFPKIYVLSLVQGKWYQWEVLEDVYDGFEADVQLITIKNVSEPLIYVRWKDSSRGSGMGEVYSGKKLWDYTGRRCYLDMVDRCTHYWKDKYGDNPSYKVFNYHYFCLAKISSNGIEVTENNTCEQKYDPVGSSRQSAHEMVSKYSTGMYIFDSGKWILK